MAIDFPNSPNVGDSFIVNSTRYTWNGLSWSSAIVDINIRSMIVTDTANVWGNLTAGNVYANNITGIYGVVNSAFVSANVAHSEAQSAFGQANTANTRAYRSYANIFVSATGNSYSWSATQNVSLNANSTANVIRIIAGNNITVETDAGNSAIRITSLATGNGGSGGSANNAFGNVFVSHTDSGYSWSNGANVSMVANSTANVIKVIGGYGINVSLDAPNSAIKFNVSNAVLTSNNTSNISGSANGDFITYNNVSNAWVANSSANVQKILFIDKAAVSYFDNTPVARVVTLMYKMPTSANLKYIEHKLGAGSLTLDVKRNGNTLNSLSNVVVNTSAQSNGTNVITSEGMFVANDKLSIQVISPSSAADFELSLMFTRG